MNSTGKRKIVEALNILENERGIKKEVVIEALKEALEKSYKKNYLSNEAVVSVEINPNSFDIKIKEYRTVVDDVNDEDLELSEEEAQEINKNYKLGDVVETLVSPDLFGRLAASQTKQILRQKIREAEKESLYNEYIDKKDEIITGIIERVEPRFAIINIGKTGALLPIKEQVASERLKEGNHIKVYINEVENSTKGTNVMVSRTDPGLVKRLFELEVPEIYDGSVEIKAVSREAGDRSKIAVYANNENVDPIGSCVGPKGTRVRNVVEELNGEMIDIVEYSKDPKVFISNALAPSNVLAVLVQKEENSAVVVVPDNQLSLAIGKRGQNARLAVRLTGWKIDIKSYTDALNEGIDINAVDVEEELVFDVEEATEFIEEVIIEEIEEFDDVEEIIEIQDEVIENIKEEIIDAKPKKKNSKKKETKVDERVVEQILNGEVINIAELVEERPEIIKVEDYSNYENNSNEYDDHQDDDEVDYDEYDSYYDED